MNTRMQDLRFGFGRRDVAARVVGGLLLAAVALPAVAPGVSAGGCGACDDDNDLLTNYEEYAIYSTDLRNPDTDFDLVLDSQEIYVFGTDPLNPDTDFDGFSDGDEIWVFNTNPLLSDREVAPVGDTGDQDGDGLGDHEEVYIYITDPLDFDTDGDGMGDGTEVHLGLNPLDPRSN